MLAPSAEWWPLLQKGLVYVNDNANRVCWTDSGRFADALVPVQGTGLAQQLADLPFDVPGARASIGASEAMSRIQPALEALKLTSTVGALASVANLGVSCAGFALVMQRLSRIDGKLDQVLGKIDQLRNSVERLHVHLEALSIARVQAAAESLSRSVFAESPAARRELAVEARHLFQVSRKLYLELWRHADPWQHNEIPLVSALELQARYVAAAIGEIQAEFVIGDEGAFRHAVRSCGEELWTTMLEPAVALRARSDQACESGPAGLALFHGHIEQTVVALRLAAETTAWTSRRLLSFADDMDIARRVGVEPWEIARIVQSAPAVDVYLLGPRGLAERLRDALMRAEEKPRPG